MTGQKIKWQTGGVLLIVIAAAIGIWYLQVYGGTDHATGSAGNPSAGTEMPGMQMGGKPGAHPSEAAPVAGHATVTIPDEIRQRIGVTIGTVKEGPLLMTVRTVGIVEPNETKLVRIHLRTEGWIQQMFVNFTGQKVQKNEPLLTIYSPNFLATQQEYLVAQRAERGAGGLPNQSSLVASARRRLELLGVPEETIEELDKTGVAQEYITLRSPIDGTVLEKNVQEKDYVTPEKQLYLIADLSTVWVQAKVYEYELPHVELGQPATVTLPALPNRELTGKIVFIQPTVEEIARTVQVRIELSNKDGLLKPGMFAHIVISHDMGEGLLVPMSAIIRTGEKDIAYREEAPESSSQRKCKSVTCDLAISFRFLAA